MKKAYLAFVITVTVVAVIALVVDNIYYNKDLAASHKHDLATNYTPVLDDEEYLIYPGETANRWNIIFPSGDEYVELKPEQIAVFLKSGEVPEDTTLVVYPQCEYQLTMEDNYILVEDFGRPVAKVPYNKAGDIGKQLLKDNE